MPAKPEIEAQLEELLDLSATEWTPLSGGYINDSYRVHTSNGPLFVKWNRQVSLEVAEAEVRSLKALRDTNTVRIPDVLCVGALENGGSFLCLEYVSLAPLLGIAAAKLGAKLAQLHLQAGKHFGFDCDNAVGLTPQRNPWSDDWVEFFIKERLRPQLELAQSKLGDDPMVLVGYDLLERIPRFFTEVDIVPSLLHGDLWSGNAGVDAEGEPVIFDPACYYGHHEAELSVMHMFGGIGPEFYDAYHDAIPKAPGFEQRQQIYQLYHYLNHLNLFGAAYYESCVGIVRSLMA